MSVTDQELDEERQAIRNMIDAIGRGDYKGAKKFVPKIKFEACSLLAAKDLFGADYIRKYGYNTEKADKKYGPDWLDRDDI